MATPERLPKPSNSTRFPEPLKAFVGWLMKQAKLVDKPASMMRECLQLGVQIRAAGQRPDERGLYWELTGAELAREIEGPVSQAVRFCESHGYPMVEIPPRLLEELELLRLGQQELDRRLARIEGLLLQLSQGGAMPQLSALSTTAGMHNAHFNDSRSAARIIQSIETNDAIASRLGFEAGIAL